MYHDFSRCAQPASRNELRVADGHGDEVVDTIGSEPGEHPRQRSTPVVTDDVSPLDPELVEHAEHVAGDERERVCLDLGRRSDSPKPRRSGTTQRYPAAVSAATW